MSRSRRWPPRHLSGCGAKVLRGETLTRAQASVWPCARCTAWAYEPPPPWIGSPTFPPMHSPRPGSSSSRRKACVGLRGWKVSVPCRDDACPTRLWLLRAKHGPAYAPPPATGTVFADVPIDAFAAAWIEALAAEGITTGCGGGNFCPSESTTRGQAAALLVRTFELE